MGASVLKRTVFDLLFPSFCLNCGVEGCFWCDVCAANVRFIPPQCIGCRRLIPKKRRVPAGRTCRSCQRKSSIYCFFSPFSYDDTVSRDLIHFLKYQRIKSLAEISGMILARYLKKFSVVFPLETILLPIPLHPRRRRRRGFNQSELVALALGTELDLTVRADVLTKNKMTKPQVECGADERRNNVLDTLAVGNAEAVRGKNVLLVDDVKTTGATLEEAARVLKRAGVKRVWAITVAH